MIVRINHYCSIIHGDYDSFEPVLINTNYIKVMKERVTPRESFVEIEIDSKVGNFIITVEQVMDIMKKIGYDRREIYLFIKNFYYPDKNLCSE